MEYIYAALLIYRAGKEINENNIKKVLEAIGVKVEEARVKALVSALEGVNIDQAIKEANIQQVIPIAIQATEQKTEKKEEKKKAEEESVKAEEAAAGLSSLFG